MINTLDNNILLSYKEGPYVVYLVEHEDGTVSEYQRLAQKYYATSKRKRTNECDKPLNRYTNYAAQNTDKNIWNNEDDYNH